MPEEMNNYPWQSPDSQAFRRPEPLPPVEGAEKAARVGCRLGCLVGILLTLVTFWATSELFLALLRAIRGGSP